MEVWLHWEREAELAETRNSKLVLLSEDHVQVEESDPRSVSSYSVFRLYLDKTRSDCWNEIETKLLPLCSEVISYFLSLTSEAHSEAWTSVLLLLFTQLEALEEERLKRFAGVLYPLLCQIWCVDVRPEVREVRPRIV